MQLPDDWMDGLEPDQILRIMLGADTSMFKLAGPDTNVDYNGDIWSIFLCEIRGGWEKSKDRNCPAYYTDVEQSELIKRMYHYPGYVNPMADPRWLAYLCYCIAHWRRQHAAT